MNNFKQTQQKSTSNNTIYACTEGATEEKPPEAPRFLREGEECFGLMLSATCPYPCLMSRPPRHTSSASPCAPHCRSTQHTVLPTELTIQNLCTYTDVNTASRSLIFGILVQAKYYKLAACSQPTWEVRRKMKVGLESSGFSESGLLHKVEVSGVCLVFPGTAM